MDASSFEQILERYHEALGRIINGDPSIYKELFSLEDDVSLANPFAPFGPVSRGRKQVEETVDRAAMNFHGGEVTAFDSYARYVGTDIAYIVEVERYTATVGSARGPVALRVTTVFRLESGAWKIVHRQADPITTPRSPESVLGR